MEAILTAILEAFQAIFGLLLDFLFYLAGAVLGIIQEAITSILPDSFSVDLAGIAHIISDLDIFFPISEVFIWVVGINTIRLSILSLRVILKAIPWIW